MNNFKSFFLSACFLLTSFMSFADNLVINITGETDFCFGSFTTICADSNPNYSYQWSTGQITNCIDLSIAGFFSVTVTDGVCTGSSNVNITQSSIFPPVIFGEDLCIGSETTLTAGTQYDSYEWISPFGLVINNIGFPWEINITEGGLYTLNVTQGACTASTTYKVFEIEPPTAIIEDNISICNSSSLGDPTTIDLTQLIFTESQYSIFDPLGFPIVPGVVDFEGQAPGTYTYTYELQANPPCEEVTYSININVINCNCPELSISDIEDFCNADNATINLFDYLSPSTDPGGNFSLYDFQGNLSTIQADSNGILLIDENLQQSAYNLFYTIDSVPIGCPESIMTSFNVLALPQIALMNPEPFCISDSLGYQILSSLEELVLGNPGNWTDQNGTPIDSNFVFNGSPLDTMIFVFTTNNATPPCPNVSESISIEFIECVETSLSQTETTIIKVSPNPSHDKINIQTNASFDKMELINTNGKQVLKGDFKKTIDISRLEPGLYYLKLIHTKDHTFQFIRVVRS